MTPEQFVYWLQGFMELTNANTLDTKQFQIVKDHLNLVFEKQTPNRKQLLTEKKVNQTHPFIPTEFGDKYDILPKIFCESINNKKLC